MLMWNVQRFNMIFSYPTLIIKVFSFFSLLGIKATVALFVAWAATLSRLNCLWGPFCRKGIIPPWRTRAQAGFYLPEALRANRADEAFCHALFVLVRETLVLIAVWYFQPLFLLSRRPTNGNSTAVSVNGRCLIMWTGADKLLVDVRWIRSQHWSTMCLIISGELCLAGDRNRRLEPGSSYQFLAKLQIDSQRPAHFLTQSFGCTWKTNTIRKESDLWVKGRNDTV